MTLGKEVSPIILADNEDPNESLTPATISQRRICEILEQPLESNSANSSSLEVTPSEDSQTELELSITGPEFIRPILDGNPIKVSLQWNDRFLYLYYISGLNPVEFYTKASGDESWLSASVIPSPAWGWLNRLNEDLFGTKLVVSDLGDTEPDLQYVLSKEIFFERGLLERGFIGEIANFYHDLSLFFDRIEEALSDWSEE